MLWAGFLHIFRTLDVVFYFIIAMSDWSTVSLPLPFPVSLPFSASVSISDPACVYFICHSAIQHIEEPWLVQSSCRPPVSFKPRSNNKCRLSFSLLLFEVPHSSTEGRRDGFEDCGTTLSTAGQSLPSQERYGSGGLEGSGASVVFVYLGLYVALRVSVWM